MKRLVALISVTGLLASGCASSASRARGQEGVLRLGIFPNLTHAPGYVALGSGILEDTLASTRVEVTVFNSGTDAGNALISGSIDATYIGPGPAAQLFLRSEGKVAIVSGAVSGGASFVVRTGAGIQRPDDLRGRKIAIPGIGNTQDVALRTWLHGEGLEAQEKGGDVAVLPVDNPELLQLFRSEEIDGAWEPEPWPSLLAAEGVAEVFVDEATLWPDGQFVTTHLLVSTAYLEAHRTVVEKLVEANVQAIELIQEDPDRARDIAARELAEAGAARLPGDVIADAWDRLTFTYDPLPSSFEQGARNAFDLGYLEENANLLDIYRLDLLNGVLRARGLEAVEVAG